MNPTNTLSTWPDGVPMVRAIWAEALGTGVYDDTDFFDAGGESKHALAICAGIEDAFHARPSLRMLFEHPRFGDYTRALGTVLPTREGT